MIRLRNRRRGASRGQAIVEMALILPLLLLIVLGTLEFGFAFDHHLTLEYGTREGARVGSALVNGGGPLGCPGGQTTEEVDSRIVAAVQRVLTSPGSPVDLTRVSEIRIFRAGSDGEELGPVNRWTKTASPGGGPTVDGVNLEFSMTATGWSACSRSNALPAQSIGVSLSYTYRYQTPATALLGWTTLTMNDQTVMNFNPTDTN